MVSMVANNGIVATLIYGIFFSILQTGALGMELITQVPSELITVLQAVIVLVVVASRGYFTLLLSKYDQTKTEREVCMTIFIGLINE